MLGVAKITGVISEREAAHHHSDGDGSKLLTVLRASSRASPCVNVRGSILTTPAGGCSHYSQITGEDVEGPEMLSNLPEVTQCQHSSSGTGLPYPPPYHQIPLCNLAQNGVDWHMDKPNLHCKVVGGCGVPSMCWPLLGVLPSFLLSLCNRHIY